MSKRSSPRFMTCAVMANGKPSPSALLILPVTRKPSSGNSPRATVPGMRGRADMPSAKKSLGSSGSYLGWLAIFCLHEGRKQKAESKSRSVSGSIRPRGAVLLLSAFCFLLSLPAESRSKNTNSRPRGAAFLPSAFCLLPSLPRDIDNLPWMECLEELPDAVEVELRIAGLDDEEELVARGLIEAPHVEDRVIRHRQAVQSEHAEDGREGREQDRAFEGDRDPGRPSGGRFA